MNYHQFKNISIHSGLQTPRSSALVWVNHGKCYTLNRYCPFGDLQYRLHVAGMPTAETSIHVKADMAFTCKQKNGMWMFSNNKYVSLIQLYDSESLAFLFGLFAVCESIYTLPVIQ